MSSMSRFCWSNGMTRIPNVITPVLPGLPLAGSVVTMACEM
jgi:hypothetical protein